MRSDNDALSIVMIEDNSTDSLLQEQLLRAAFKDLTLVKVSSLREGLEALSTNHVDAILSDLNLPDSFGIATVEALSGEAETTVLVVISGVDLDEETRYAAIELGAQDFLIKSELTESSMLNTVQYAVKRKRLELATVEQARTDPLTGLLNRRALIEEIERIGAAAPEEMLGLLYIDLDSFKSLNDDFGHHVGDAVLESIAARVTKCVREYDEVGRLGGDEFSVLLTQLPNAKTATEVARRICTVIEEPLRIDNREYRVTASIGIATSVVKTDVDSLLLDADRAMYQAKRRGGGQCVRYNETMQAETVARLELDRDLAHAVANQFREFDLHYQPIVPLPHGDPVAYEALIRWRHPTRGLLAAEDFVPAAEEAGLITLIDRWVVESACRQLRQWQKTPELQHLKLNINFSPLGFDRAADTFTFIEGMVRAHQVTRGRLVIELTERTLVRSAQEILDGLMSLRVAGVEFAIDDFGMGYSSLAYLQRLPVDALKIDRSFIAENATTLIEVVLSLAAAMRIPAIAEGVETAEQHEMLAAMGCQFAQGYLYGRPEPLSLTANDALPSFPHSRAGDESSALRA